GLSPSSPKWADRLRRRNGIRRPQVVRGPPPDPAPSNPSPPPSTGRSSRHFVVVRPGLDQDRWYPAASTWVGPACPRTRRQPARQGDGPTPRARTRQG